MNNKAAGMCDKYCAIQGLNMGINTRVWTTAIAGMIDLA